MENPLFAKVNCLPFLSPISFSLSSFSFIDSSDSSAFSSFHPASCQQRGEPEPLLSQGKGSECPPLGGVLRSLCGAVRGAAEKFHPRSLDCCLPTGLSGKELRAGEQGQPQGPVAGLGSHSSSRPRSCVAPRHLTSSQFLHLQSENQSAQSCDEKTLVRAVERFLPAGHPGHSADTSAVWP